MHLVGLDIRSSTIISTLFTSLASPGTSHEELVKSFLTTCPRKFEDRRRPSGSVVVPLSWKLARKVPHLSISSSISSKHASHLTVFLAHFSSFRSASYVTWIRIMRRTFAHLFI
ncbi:hypothetical protein OCU04_009563 [Sclerotinia nivalis]|uniref:Uncharacterized protein n=1 Tax=Sclerotinia nivalis TaxID=352851 RepID=A0A9X0AFE1_9HELO|nr:hypothetical protein OCU04_009563 [Sclerotinia nivalis]